MNFTLAPEKKVRLSLHATEFLDQRPPPPPLESRSGGLSLLSRVPVVTTSIPRPSSSAETFTPKTRVQLSVSEKRAKKWPNISLTLISRSFGGNRADVRWAAITIALSHINRDSL